MKLSVILNIYEIKVKSFLGAFRASKVNLALLLVYVLGLIPSIFGFSTIVVEAVKRNGANFEAYTEFLAALISIILSMIFLSSLRGYTVFEYEQNMFFTSPITPRKFLIASLLADLTASLIFFYPVFAISAAIAYSLNISFPLALVMFFIILLFIFTLIFLKFSLSIISSLYKSFRIKAIIAWLAIMLLLPALSRFLDAFPLRYTPLPYPSTSLAKCLLTIMYDREIMPLDISIFSFYVLFSFAFFMFVSKKNFFQHVASIPFFSPFDASMRMQTLKMESSIKTFSRIGLIFTLNVESKSLLRFLMRKEMIRMARDGSLVAVTFLYLIAAFISIIVARVQETALPLQTFTTFLLGTYSLIIPIILANNWRLADFRNMWIPLTSSLDRNMIIKAVLYDFILVASAVPTIVVLIFSAIYGVNPLLLMILVISTSIIGNSVSLYLMIKIFERKRKSTFSLLIGWASTLLSGLLSSPTYLFTALSLYLKLNNVLNTLISILILVYSILMMKYFLRKSEENLNNIEI